MTLFRTCLKEGEIVAAKARRTGAEILRPLIRLLTSAATIFRQAPGVLAIKTSIGFGLGWFFAWSAPAAEAPVALKLPAAPDISFRNEIQRAIDRGLESLRARQGTNRYWSTADHPAVTALALMAFLGEPKGRYQTNP